MYEITDDCGQAEEPAVSPIIPQPDYVRRPWRQVGSPRPPDLGHLPVRLSKTTAWRRWILVGGAAAAAVPGAPGIVWMLAGRPGAQPFLAAAIGLALVTALLNAVAAMYQARQETRRREIECRGADVLADALARCIDDTHARAQNLSPVEEATEAAQVRASASAVLSRMQPTVLALTRRSLDPEPRTATNARRKK